MKGVDLSKMTAKERLDYDAEVDSYIELLKELRNSAKASVLLGVEARTFHGKQEDVHLPLLAKIDYDRDTQDFIFYGRVGQVIAPDSVAAPTRLFGDDPFLQSAAGIMFYMKVRVLAAREQLKEHFTQEQLDEFPNVIGWYLREYQ